LAIVSRILKGKVANPDVSFIIAPGSKQVVENLYRDGYLADLISAGARLMENACGFCVGNGQSPSTKSVSLRTSNRNFPGRSGTRDADVYLVSPETAAAAVITGKFTDPRDLGIPYPEIKIPSRFYIDDAMIIKPDGKTSGDVGVYRGPNIGNPPETAPLTAVLYGEVAIKLGDKITTDHIMPAGELLKYRSNIPKYSEFVFAYVDREFSLRAKKIRDDGRCNVIVAGFSYGQGSSREHAAICPMFLGVRAVIAKSFERIHAANLVNFGIIPLIFKEEGSYELIEREDRLEIADIRGLIAEGREIVVINRSKGTSFGVSCNISERQKKILLAGGVLNLKEN
jgi:aconitate hydratase